MIRAAAGYQDGVVEESSASLSAPVGRNSADRFERVGGRIVELSDDPIFADWIKRSRDAGYENAPAIDFRWHRVSKVKWGLACGIESSGLRIIEFRHVIRIAVFTRDQCTAI